MRYLPIILCALCSVAHAQIIKITFSGSLEQWAGKSVYDAQIPGDLPNPTPNCEWEIRLKTNAIDSDPDPTRGVYTSTDSSITLRFGPFEETHWGATVEVMSGYAQPGGGHLWGFFFRNKYQSSAFGVYRPAATGIYAFYVNASSIYGPTVVPNDSLGNLFTAQGHFQLIAGTHAYMNGVAGYPPIFIHAETDTVQTPFAAKLVE